MWSYIIISFLFFNFLKFSNIYYYLVLKILSNASYILISKISHYGKVVENHPNEKLSLKFDLIALNQLLNIH